VTVSERDVSIESSGRRLAGLIVESHDGASDVSRPGVLFIHGYGSDQRGYRPRAEAVAAAIMGVSLTFDLGGHGASTGSRDSLTERDHLADALAAYDELAVEPGVALDRIGVCAASYGAYLAASLVAERGVARLLLRAPAVDRDGRPPAALSDYPGPVLVVESGADEVIPKSAIAAYLEACGGRARHEVIDGATHALTEPRWRQEFQDLIVDWFSRL
jgi:pimeloyl-ACP methyl ester carboxylesterase